MAEHAESSFSAATLDSFLAAHPRRALQWRPELPPERPSTRRSLIAGVFLVTCLAVYLAVGFAAILVIQHAWLTIAR
jgi:hypothetical protein